MEADERDIQGLGIDVRERKCLVSDEMGVGGRASKKQAQVQVCIGRWWHHEREKRTGAESGAKMCSAG